MRSKLNQFQSITCNVFDGKYRHITGTNSNRSSENSDMIETTAYRILCNYKLIIYSQTCKFWNEDTPTQYIVIYQLQNM
jgi:hypothetical protein